MLLFAVVVVVAAVAVAAVVQEPAGELPSHLQCRNLKIFPDNGSNDIQWA
jgi:hypothetical protein